ncbi:Ficolin-2 [Chionoecetes opilio]|uniref:Ficolin-2 n=1 Tax=Chionoecetes opilio TaxID=41210 RepID=A0A8J4Y6B6_CHIOP|nr:Ficolin-2 [Chionoecetes opilio]
MLLFLLSTVGLAMAGGPSTTPGPATATFQPGLHIHQSLLTNLLLYSGYSDTCVATALDACKPISEQHQQPPLIQFHADVVSKLNDLGFQHFLRLVLVLYEPRYALLHSTLSSTHHTLASTHNTIDSTNHTIASTNHISTVSQLAQLVPGLPACCLGLPACSGQARNKQEAKEVLKEGSVIVNKLESRPRHCKDLLNSGDTGSGLRLVYPYPGQPHHHVTVFCDHTVDGGGWTVFQRRTNDSIRQDFYRTWIEYQLGFGDLQGEFWLGLDLLHVLTSTTLQELRIDLADYEGGERWAKYSFFNIGSDETKYRLSVGRYTGDAGDAMQPQHSGDNFSTHDQDNDTYGNNCAVQFRGAWWYRACHHANLNGYQHQGNHSSFADGINWHAWRGYNYSLRRTSMMIRPAF